MMNLDGLMEYMPDISIVIVNWNVKDYLKKCLDSIFRETKGISFEVIVVDNASTDGSWEMLVKEFPRVKLIENEKNVGFSRANNQGLKIAKGDYSLLLNPDTVIVDRAIEKLYDFAKEHSNIVALGPMILNADAVTIQYECARTIPTIWREFCYLSEISLHLKGNKTFSNITMDYWNHQNSKGVSLLSGSCMLCNTDVLREVDFLDEDYFLYADDVDLCFRLGQKGKIYYLADAKIIHYGGRSSKQSNDNLWIVRCESTKIFFKKNMGLSYGSGYRLIVGLSQIVKIVFIVISFLKNKDRSSRKMRNDMLQCWNLLMWSIKKI